MDELLLLQRDLVDESVYPLTENAPLEELLQHFETAVRSLQSQEPSFWQLKVVQFIRDVIKKRVGERIFAVVEEAANEGIEDLTEIVTRSTMRTKQSVELEETLKQIQSDVEKEVHELAEMANGGNDRRTRHFLEMLWGKLDQITTEREMQPEDEERRSGGVEGSDNCSFSMLTFDDDLNEISRSAMSFPCLEDFPMTIRRIQSEDLLERAAGFDELVQMPIVEIIHSGPVFPTACSAVVNLFLDTGNNDVADRAKKVVCDLAEQVDEATQFFELYAAVLDFMMTRFEAGDLKLERQNIVETSTAPNAIAILDCFRVWLYTLRRVTRHWVYFSPEALARCLYSTFWFLTMYSKSETEVEARHMNPLMVLSLVENDSMQWLKLWLLNSPNLTQLFVTISETGFVSDLLQYFSRVRPLAEQKGSSSEKLIFRGVLSILSYICEYSEGREVVSRWRRISAHAYIKQRRTGWISPSFQSVAEENDALYHVSRPQFCEEQNPGEDLEAEYDRLGAGAIDALTLTSFSTVLVHADCTPNDEEWSRIILKSVSTYLHTTQFEFSCILQLIENCWKSVPLARWSSKDTEAEFPWFPFRQLKPPTDVCHMIHDSVSLRIRRGSNSSTDVAVHGEMILQTILSSSAVTIQLYNLDLIKTLLEVCKTFLRTVNTEVISRASARTVKLVQSIADLMRSIRIFKLGVQFGVVDDLVEICSGSTLSSLNSYIAAALLHSSSGVRGLKDSAVTELCLDCVRMQWHDQTKINYRDVLSCLALPATANAFFMFEGVQETVFEAVAKLRESCDFTIAINSPLDESPTQLSDFTRQLQLLECCLSTQHAAAALASVDGSRSRLISFILETLSKHNQTCMSSSSAEDTCCVGFQLAVALSASVPAMLACSGIFSKVNFLHLDNKNSNLISNDSESLGPCSLLENQLRYEFEIIGGPSEKHPRCELYDFDGNSKLDGRESGNTPKTMRIPEFVFTLQKKILLAIEEGIQAGPSVPMDFVQISQASWELVNELESEPKEASDHVLLTKSAAAFTGVFAKLIYSLVTSKRSRLEPTTAKVRLAIDSKSKLNSFFPPDSDRKLMNRFYKNYAQRLSLEVSPTLLHSITKKFGRASMDCFPVTILMLLYPSYEDADILNVLTTCMTSASSGYLWPSAAAHYSHHNDVSLPSVIAIVEAVEAILERESPQILQALEKCSCSLLDLVQRWHGQSFWNYFDWENIVTYTYFGILYGAEFQVYIMVAVLKHLEPTMRDLTGRFSSRSLTPFLMLIREPIKYFRFSPWRTLLLRLRSEYHEMVGRLLFPLEQKVR